MREILLTALLLLSPSIAAADGSWGTAILDDYDGYFNTRTVILPWTGDASNGSVPDLTINATTNADVANFIKGWRLRSAATDPGSPPPTSYSVYVKEQYANGSEIDLFGDQLTSRSATADEHEIPIAGCCGYTPRVNGDWVISLSGQTNASAQGVLILNFEK